MLHCKAIFRSQGAVAICNFEPLEVPRTRMVNLQLLVDRHRSTGIQTIAMQTRSSTQRNRWEKFPKMAWIWDFGWHGFGVDFHIFGTRKKRAQKIHAKSTPVSGTKPAPFFFAEIRASQPQSITQKGVHTSVDSPGARTLLFAAFEPFLASIAQTPFCAILWRSPIRAAKSKIHSELPP